MEWTLQNKLIAIAFSLSVIFSLAFFGMYGIFYVHDHGTLTVTINNDTIDFDTPEYHDRHANFHFHEGDGNMWHHHPENVFHSISFERMTVEEALATLDIHVTETTVTIDNTTYDGTEPGIDISMSLNGDDFEPSNERLHEDDDIVIIIETDS